MKLASRGPEETEALGVRLGRILRPGDIVAFYGDLGAGKTTMIRGIASALGISGRDVTSASFTIIAEYRAEVPFYHVDLYRINRTEDLDSTGIWDCLGEESIAVIEWAERMGEETPDNIIRIEFTHGEDELREISIEGIDEKNWDNL